MSDHNLFTRYKAPSTYAHDVQHILYEVYILSILGGSFEIQQMSYFATLSFQKHGKLNTLLGGPFDSTIMFTHTFFGAQRAVNAILC